VRVAAPAPPARQSPAGGARGPPGQLPALQHSPGRWPDGEAWQGGSPSFAASSSPRRCVVCCALRVPAAGTTSCTWWTSFAAAWCSSPSSGPSSSCATPPVRPGTTGAACACSRVKAPRCRILSKCPLPQRRRCPPPIVAGSQGASGCLLLLWTPLGPAASPRTAHSPLAETDGKVVRTLVKLTLFRQFYIMVRWGA
jgi:hypothetical protein